MQKKHEIISFDPNRVWFEEIDNKKVCKKRTSKKEVESLMQASKFLMNKKLNVFEKEYELSTPEILSWNENTGILTMSFCKGDNLESIICEGKNRSFGVNVLQETMFFVLKEKFFWRDFAPRNIIIQDNNIYIMDFEKGIGNKNITLEEYLRLRVYREYSSFLLPEERGIDIDKVFTLRKNEDNKLIKVDTCSRRIIILAKAMGYYPYMTDGQNQNMRKLVIQAEQPYRSNGEIIYPRIDIERLLEDKSDEAYEKYARLIINKDKKITTKDKE